MTLSKTLPERARAIAIMALVAGLGCLSGCGGDTPTAPGPPRVIVEGTWTGMVNDRAAGVGQLSLTLSGFDTLGVGTFTLTFPGTGATIQGSVQALTQGAPTIDLTFASTAPPAGCPPGGLLYPARLTLTGNRMTGTHGLSVGCSLLSGGSTELTRP